jgi:hypothetical protein
MPGATRLAGDFFGVPVFEGVLTEFEPLAVGDTGSAAAAAATAAASAAAAADPLAGPATKNCKTAQRNGVRSAVVVESKLLQKTLYRTVDIVPFDAHRCRFHRALASASGGGSRGSLIREAHVAVRPFDFKRRRR